jgi:hypothetical protein
MIKFISLSTKGRRYSIMSSENVQVKRSKIEDMTLDIEALNELLRQYSGMGQGQIDTEAQEIKEQLRRKWQNGKDQSKM